MTIPLDTMFQIMGGVVVILITPIPVILLIGIIKSLWN